MPLLIEKPRLACDADQGSRRVEHGHEQKSEHDGDTAELEGAGEIHLENVGTSDGGAAKTPCQGSSPSTTAATVTASTPSMMALGIFRTASPEISRKPATASQACGFERSPSLTSVTGSSATIPAFWSAISARKRPMPAAMPSFRLIGIASISPQRRERECEEQHAGEEHEA